MGYGNLFGFLIHTLIATTHLLFSSDFWILCTIKSINQSIKTIHSVIFQWLLDFVCYWINQSINRNNTLCYFPVTFGFCVLLNQSINQSKQYTLSFSSDFWILCAIESINQSIETIHSAIFQWLLDFVCYWINQSINQNRTLCHFPVTFGFCVLLNQSINQSINTLTFCLANMQDRLVSKAGCNCPSKRTQFVLFFVLSWKKGFFELYFLNGRYLKINKNTCWFSIDFTNFEI